MFKVSGKEDHVIILDIALYGLRESANLWFFTFEYAIEDLGFESSTSDACLYRHKTSRSFLVTNVDDFILATKDIALKDRVFSTFSEKFICSELPGKKFTSYHIQRDRLNRTILLHQEPYIREILSVTSMENCAPLSAPPIEINYLSKADCPKSEGEYEEMMNIPYREIVGALLHLSTKTRPEISHAVSVLARYCSNPGRKHWSAVKQLLRYLKGSMTHGLLLGGESLTLKATVDANFAQNPDTRKSHVGFAIKFGVGVISSKSVGTKSVMVSSCEAEIAAMFYGTTEVIWFRQLLEFLGYKQTESTEIFSDNQGGIKWSTNPETNGRMKHINVKFFFIRERIADNQIKPSFISGANNPADLLTKSLPPKTFIKHRNYYGLLPCDVEF
jgi:hypothetical protein